jgi:hypothetical protein
MFDLSKKLTVILIIFWWLEKERLSVCKPTTQKFDLEGFRLKKLNEVKGKEYQVKIPNRFPALENLRL